MSLSARYDKINESGNLGDIVETFKKEQSTFEPTNTTKSDIANLDPTKDIETIRDTIGQEDHLPFINDFIVDLESGAFGQKAGYGKNYAKADPKHRANDLSHKETLRLSRLADYINNSSWRRHGSLAGNGNIKMNSKPKFREWTKLPNIETEEMRQQRVTSDLQKEMNQRRISRQQNYQDVHLKMYEQHLMQKLELNKDSIKEFWIRLGDKWKEELYLVMKKRDFYFHSRQAIFDQIGLMLKKSKIVWNYYFKDRIFGSQIANALSTVMPDPFTVITNSFFEQYKGDLQSGDPDRLAHAVNKLIQQFRSMAEKITPELATGISNLIKLLGGGVVSIGRSVLGF